MGTVASQITSLSIVYSTVYSGAYQRKHQSSASLAFVRGFHRCPVNSPHKWPLTRKMFLFDDIIMCSLGPCAILNPLILFTKQWGLVTHRCVSELGDLVSGQTGAKPLPEPMLMYWPLNPWKQTLVKLNSKYKRFLSLICICKCHLENVSHYNSDFNEFIDWGRVMHICIGTNTNIGQITACHLAGAKPLSEPMLEYCLLGP